MARLLGYSILGLIVLNVLAVMLETVDGLSERYAREFELFEWVSLVIFTVEYLARFWASAEDTRYGPGLRGRLRYAMSPLAVLDLLAILPYYVGFASADMRFIRAFRLLRVARLAQAWHLLDSFRLLGRVLRRKRHELMLTSSVMALLLLVAANAIYFAECHAQPEAFPNIPATLWWAVITLTTVGYGDVYPITVVGRAIGAVVAVLGVAFFALPAGILTSGFVAEIQSKKHEIWGQSAGAPEVCPHCGEALHGG